MMASTASAATYGTCPQYESLLVKYAPPGGWNIKKMSYYMHRESNCTPWVRSWTHDSGLLQINDINHQYLRAHLHQWVDARTLYNPVQNVRSAAALCSYWRRVGRSCYRPWGG